MTNKKTILDLFESTELTNLVKDLQKEFICLMVIEEDL